MFSPSRMITPAPRKPIPDTICAATRPALAGSVDMELRMKTAAPVATSIGSQAGHTLAPLALGANYRARHIASNKFKTKES